MEFQDHNIYIKTDIERKVRSRFKTIVGGKGFLIPRIAIKIALDDLFGKESSQQDQSTRPDEAELYEKHYDELRYIAKGCRSLIKSGG